MDMAGQKATYYDELAQMGLDVALLKTSKISETELAELVSGITALLKRRHIALTNIEAE